MVRPKTVRFGNALTKKLAKTEHSGQVNILEARRWLSLNENRSALATNQFGNTSGALDAVRTLYRAGAEKVFVVNPDYRYVENEGGPYADTLLVKAKKGKEEAVLIAIMDYSPDNIQHLGRGIYRLWWD